MKTIGMRIKEQRKLLELSQVQVSKSCEVSQAAVGYWETDTTVPSGKKLLSLAKALRRSAEWIMSGKEDGLDNPNNTPPDFSEELSPSPFTKVYKLFEDAVLYTEEPVDYTQEVKAQCLIEMYEAEIQGKSPAGAMLRYLMSTSPQR